MNSRLSWSVEGIDPSVRERAEAAARRAGVSLDDWLNSTIGEPPAPNFRARPDPHATTPSRQAPAVADIHQRLDAITRQIEQIARPAVRSDDARSDLREAPRGEPAVAQQLNDAITRLDARLAQISNPAPARQAQLEDQQRQTDMVERAAAQVYRPSPPLSPSSFGFAIEEIAARQNELDHHPAEPRSVPPRVAPPRTAPPTPATTPAMATPIAAVPPPGPDFSALERHLVKITSQIEALQRPDAIEQSIAAFRGELTEIRQAITEAMPRQAIESIENEVRSLSKRIDDTRQRGFDEQALAGIERALGEIREVLGTLTPAEQLTGYDDAIRNLGAKLDLIVRASDDPSTVRQLESAIAALRSIVSNVASNDALVRLSDDVHTLSTKVDQLTTRSGNNSDSFAILEQRIAALTATLESREPPVVNDNSEQIESALRALSDRLDRLPVGNDDASAFAHLEQRVSYLLERLEASTEQRGGHLGRVEDGLHDILRHLENQNASFAALTESTRRVADPADDNDLVDLVKRELSDLRAGQSEAGRHAQVSLEAVQNTLSHVVNRLASIEGDLRAPESADDKGLADIVKRELSDILSGQSEAGRRAQDSLEAVHNTLGHVVNRLVLIEGDLRAPEPADDNHLVETVKRELLDIRISQSEAGRHAQDSLEAVHNTLGHVVDRLALIEGDLRAVRIQPVALEPAAPPAPPPAPPQAPAPRFELPPETAPRFELPQETAPRFEPPQEAAPQFEPPQEAAPSFELPQQAGPRFELPPQPKPELPNPAAAEGPFITVHEHFASAPREFQSVQIQGVLAHGVMTQGVQTPMPAVAAITSKAVSEMLEPYAVPPRAAIAPELPPDHPLEPGTRPSARAASPSERIAASESAISEIPAASREPTSTSNFIAAARRAAQAAAAAPVADKTARGPVKKPASSSAKEASTVTSKIRSLLIGASVVVIVLGTFKMAMTLLDSGNPPAIPAVESPGEQTPSAAHAPVEDSAKAPEPAAAPAPAPSPVTPSMTSPVPIGRQSLNAPAPKAPESLAPAAIPAPVGDVTGAIPAVSASPGSHRLAMVAVPPTERLPEAIGGLVLRTAALKGDPSAAYEIGLRFAEGKGVAPNFDEAAKWYDRAAQAGVVPAIFRLGTLYEKGLSVKKDADIARRYYSQAAERGNAKAMHNLAVLDADGGGQGANYKNASQWFRKAADRGVADSQYNLGILYARGIGVEQNLAESFKWFSLAAAQGDADALRKRDDIAKRLDTQSLAAAKLAIQTFTPEPQPDDAVNVATPAGGWDQAPTQAAKPGARPVLTKRAAALH